MVSSRSQGTFWGDPAAPYYTAPILLLVSGGILGAVEGGILGAAAGGVTGALFGVAFGLMMGTGFINLSWQVRENVRWLLLGLLLGAIIEAAGIGLIMLASKVVGAKQEAWILLTVGFVILLPIQWLKIYTDRRRLGRALQAEAVRTVRDAEG